MSFDPVMPPYNASDPTARFLSSSCLDFLLIELVPLTYRVTNQLEVVAREQEEAGLAATSLNSGVDGASANGNGNGNGVVVDGDGPASGLGITVGGGGGAGAAGKGIGPAGTETVMDEEEEREAVCRRLEGIGYRVGQGLVERFSRDRPRFTDTLDVIKFLCKDLWTLVFRKQVDNLKTNHRGVYVLTDNAFRPFSRMSAEVGSQAVQRAQPFLWFPCGIVRGALAALGITATVQAESTELPGAVFQIKTVSAKTP
ncbi:trafficking protein particle complex subunit 6B [Parachaetomium inaequale]|uniref:Trafficking protein particle complex subunit 6B n=1 Tax=Parachaetomium inaequale TaxID=2588326 RepID=A0AAN6PAZ8_9PEZI|nr:trafficking protein particle complex subunit 6B [Parachaetomium inaequale]